MTRTAPRQRARRRRAICGLLAPAVLVLAPLGGCVLPGAHVHLHMGEKHYEQTEPAGVATAEKYFEEAAAEGAEGPRDQGTEGVRH